MSELGERIRRARDLAGINQTAMATAVGVSRGAATQWESGATEPTPANLRKIAQATGVSYEWIATGVGEPRVVATNRLVESFDPDGHDLDADRLTEGKGVSTDKPYVGDSPNASPVIETTAGGGPGGLALPAALPSGGVIYSEDAVLG